ncbi:glycine cleavage system protein H [Mycoplasma phocoenae]|uniref:Glycine cleavage system protein H n=1 Tax=Mycoplasma phocoenae TaxID=754517 RepID=A0A858U3R0_9MOLU|nr:glycine cleavage system protein H [Mycoplasma phocoenae]QJG67062.1 glycine cleavage system protein H [Mycoplasma phocoenae]
MKIKDYLIIEKQNDLYTIRLSAELQDDLGTITFAQMNKKKFLNKDDTLMSIEASKAAIDIKAPISGKVYEFNKNAIENPRLLNSELNENNWVITLTDVDIKQYNLLEDY